MTVKTLLSVCSSCYVQILSTDDAKDFETYAYLDYFINEHTGLYYPSRNSIPDDIAKMKVDFFIDSTIKGHDGVLHNGTRIYVK